MKQLFNCLFLPGLPGERKEYKFFSDIKKAGGNIIWQTYTGSYERVNEGEFNQKNCINDIKQSLTNLQSNNEPYIIIAYSFSSYLIRHIDAEGLKGCEAIFLFSPILSLNKDDIESDFCELICKLDDNGKISSSIKSWQTITSKKVDNRLLITWLDNLQKFSIPLFCFSSTADSASFDSKLVQKLTEKYNKNGSSVFISAMDDTTHKFDSFYQTIARSFMWAIIVKIMIESETKIRKYYYIWGSMIDVVSWSKYSDIDLLLIADLSPEMYAIFAKISKQFEYLSGIHFGLSVNKPIDLERTSYIRRNRGAIFLHELNRLTVPLSGKKPVREVTQIELKKDALNTNLMLRSEIEKQLLKYHNDKAVAKKIIKSFLQAYRLLQYGRGNSTADYRNINFEKENLKSVIKKAFFAKHEDFVNVSFHQLLEIDNAMNNIIIEQKALIDNE